MFYSTEACILFLFSGFEFGYFQVVFTILLNQYGQNRYNSQYFLKHSNLICNILYLSVGYSCQLIDSLYALKSLSAPRNHISRFSLWQSGPNLVLQIFQRCTHHQLHRDTHSKEVLICDQTTNLTFRRGRTFSPYPLLKYILIRSVGTAMTS